MNWNYRLIHQVSGVPGEHAVTLEHIYTIHEVFYDPDGTPLYCTEKGVNVGGETVEEARRTYALMAEAFGQPVLEMTAFDPKEAVIEGSSRRLKH